MSTDINSSGAQGANGNRATRQTEIPSWFKLDNASTIYPAARTRVWANVYRIGVVLTEDVEPEALRRAVSDIYDRIPSYFVQLRKGIFWNYLERATDCDVVEEESHYPCEPMEFSQSDKPLFRVIYYKRRVCIETFHAVADGGASISVFKTILCRYFEITKGITIKELPDDILDIDASPEPEEWEDSFQKVYKPVKGLSVGEEKSYQYEPQTIPNFYRAVFGLVPVEDIKRMGKQSGLNITEYIAAALMYALYLNAPKPLARSLKLSIPISLRPIFGSKSLRNFSLFTNIGFRENPNGETDFEYIAQQIKGQIKAGMDVEKLEKAVSQNVGVQRNLALRVVPIILKKAVLKIAYARGQSNYVCCVSNLGIFRLPDELQQYVERVEILLGGSPDRFISCAVVSDGKYINIGFASAAKQIPVQRDFFRFLSQNGARVRIETNFKESFNGQEGKKK